MVAETSKGKQAASDGLRFRVPPCIPHRPVNSETMAEAAARIADRLIARRAVDQELGETALFTALHTCAIHATGPQHQASNSETIQDNWASRWTALRDHLIEQNLPLAYAMAGRFRWRAVEWEDARAEALHALVRAVEGFNPWFGFRFSTYACNAIQRALIHLGRKVAQHRSRFPVGHDLAFERPLEADTDSELYVDRLTRVLDQNLGELTDREAMILSQRFPRDGGEALTLGELGEVMGLSKERVRQIQKRALCKLRSVLEVDRALQ